MRYELLASTVWLGLACELPLMMALLAKLRIVHWRWLLALWPWVMLFSLVITMRITPTLAPAPGLIIGMPMLVFYVLGVGLARIVG